MTVNVSEGDGERLRASVIEESDSVMVNIFDLQVREIFGSVGATLELSASVS